MPKIAEIGRWLTSTVSRAEDGQYRHQLLKEDPPRLAPILAELRAYFREAHRDALRHYRSLLSDPLHPFLPPPPLDPASFYPHRMGLSVQKGYFGEVFAGIVAEHFAPFGDDGWEVPAFLFRLDKVAFDQFETYRQTGQEPGPLPGRTGDDCLAFRRDAQGRILRFLYCEAKCTADHDATMVAKAHEKVGEAPAVDILRCVEVLKDRDDPESRLWVASLRQFYLAYKGGDEERHDLVSYVCGRTPVRAGRSSWMSKLGPHDSYAASRKLEAVEVHLRDVEVVIRLVYGSQEGGTS